jgi:RND family efflux transporter MFP subunit
MPRSARLSVPAVAAVLALTLGSGACGEPAESASASQSAARVVQLAPENVATAAVGDLSSGPIISGQLTPAREASVRAQVGGSIVALTVDRGEPVAAGATLARISSRDLDAAHRSADAAVRSAETALAVATSEAQRTEALVKGGALAERDLEQARNTVSTAEAQVAAASARRSSVEQQLDDTSIKAPFAGIVSARPASVGDVVSPGTELLTIIDPSSMRLEALVPAEQLSEVRRGAKVRFVIRGVAGEFTGTVDRLNPAADPVTRQVSLFVSLPNTGGKLLAGLFAEGRVESASHRGVVVPLSAVDETGPQPVVTLIKDGKAAHVPVQLGIVQTRTEQVEVTSGIGAGDVVILGSAKTVPAGTAVTVVK